MINIYIYIYINMYISIYPRLFWNSYAYILYIYVFIDSKEIIFYTGITLKYYVI